MTMVTLDPPRDLDMKIGEVIFTQRAIRRLKPDPISDANLKTVLDAASKAPNTGNEQPLRFLVIQNREKIREFGALYREGWWAKRGDQGWFKPEDLPDDPRYKVPMHLANEIKDAPVVILAIAPAGCGSSVFPAVQNLLLAARALGIGTTLTTLHPKVMERTHELFEIPRDLEIYCCLPLGYPRGRFGTTRRRATAETTYYDGWGHPPPWG